MWLILQQKVPTPTYVIATGEQHSVREFRHNSFPACRHRSALGGRRFRREGHRQGQQAGSSSRVSPDFYRPTDVINLLGDPSKARRELGWNPSKTPFEQLVRIMVDADMAKVAMERAGESVKPISQNISEKES